MEGIKAGLDRAFEKLGCGIRAYVEDGDLFVRDIFVTETGNGMIGVFEASHPEKPLFSMPAGEDNSIAAAVAFQVVKKIISNAIEE